MNETAGALLRQLQGAFRRHSHEGPGSRIYRVIIGGWGMRYIFNTLSVLSVSLMAAGCASVGNERIADATQESVAAQLVKGKTTQAEVRKFYGDPIKTSFTDSGNESWEYEFARMEPKPTNFIPYVNLIHSGAEGDKKSIVILFNKSKVVQQYTVSNSKVEVSQGLITR